AEDLDDLRLGAEDLAAALAGEAGTARDPPRPGKPPPGRPLLKKTHPKAPAPSPHHPPLPLDTRQPPGPPPPALPAPVGPDQPPPRGGSGGCPRGGRAGGQNSPTAPRAGARPPGPPPPHHPDAQAGPPRLGLPTHQRRAVPRPCPARQCRGCGPRPARGRLR